MKSIRVCVVDDSVVVRRLVADALRGGEGIGEVLTAGDGRAGVDLVRSARPDVVTMDIEMPILDGIGAVREIRTFDRRVPIVMFSTLTEAGARATLNAFAAGATDFVTKPGQARSIGAGLQAVRNELLPKVQALGDPASASRSAAASVRPMVRTVPPPGGPARRTEKPRLLAIGSSTGGPEALSRVLARLPASLSVPVIITQHMPAMFTKMLAERLDGLSGLQVREATDGMVLSPGTATVAPGGRHMLVVRKAGQLHVRLTDSPPVNSCRPSVDVTLQSLPAAVGPACLTLILTGMGADGAEGVKAVAAAGGTIWAQDEQSSVVWGMPGAAVATGVVSRVLALDLISDALNAAVAPAPASRVVGSLPPPRPALSLPTSPVSTSSVSTSSVSTRSWGGAR